MGRYADQIDQRVARLASRQHEHVTRSQLLELGLTASGIKRRVVAGRLIRVYDGVYAVGHVRVDAVSRAVAAVLACGPGAVLSHHSAAALWGLRNWGPGPIHVIAPSKHRRRGIKAHRCALTPRAVRKHLNVPVTSPARTLLDIRRSLTDKQLIRAINDALISKCLRASELDGSPLHRFVGELSRSRLEDDFKPWRAHFNLPEPLYNVVVHGRERDVYYPEERLIVELDGWEFHRTKIAFEIDRERDAETLAAGLVTVRITRERLRSAPAREAERLRAILAARRREVA